MSDDEAAPILARPTSTWIYTETEEIKKHYEFKEKLGQPGQFGYAVRAIKKHPKPGEPKEYAVKVISKARFSQTSRNIKEVFQAFRDEVDIMNRCAHPNVIKFFEIFEEQLWFYIVMELCVGGELFDRITALGTYNEKDAAYVFRQLVSGVAYLHSQKIAHCDLKPDNFIFLNKDKNSPVKIIDFGMSKIVRPRQYFRKFCGTPYYVAPEVLEYKYTEACDMWSLGVVLFVMLHGYPPFHADPNTYGSMTDERIFQLIKVGFEPVIKKGYKNHFPKNIPISKQAMDLIARLLVKDTSTRLTAQDVLEHPWLTGEAPDSALPLTVLSSLKGFSNTSKFKLSVVSIMSDCLSETDMDNLRNSFVAMDENKDGTISVDELKKAIQKTDKSLTEENILKIFNEADIDGNGSISYEELLRTHVSRKLSQREEALWQAFCKLDVNGDGTITIKELQAVLQAQAVEAKELLASADKDGNGVIDYQEFLTLFDQEINIPSFAIKTGPSTPSSHISELAKQQKEEQKKS